MSKHLKHFHEKQDRSVTETLTKKNIAISTGKKASTEHCFDDLLAKANTFNCISVQEDTSESASVIQSGRPRFESDIKFLSSPRFRIQCFAEYEY